MGTGGTTREDPLGADALDAVVRLLSELELAAGDERFYGRICEAACRLTSLERAVLFLYDPERRLVLPAGSHGVAPELLAHTYGSLEETPIAQRALAQQSVVDTEDLAVDVPSRYAALPGVTKLTCAPVAAAGRWLGVIFADAGGGDFELTDAERSTLHALGRTAALAAHVRDATSQRERGRLLLERVALARDVHEQVMQRLFGVSMALGSAAGSLPAAERVRCSSEVELALAELRDALTRSLDPVGEPSRTTLREELGRLDRQYKDLPLQVDWADGAEVPAGLEPLAVSVLGEALRNVEKHSEAAEASVIVEAEDDVFTLEVRNSGLQGGEKRDAGRSGGLGLRLASFEAMQRGGVLEFGRDGDQWRVRLVLPASDHAFQAVAS